MIFQSGPTDRQTEGYWHQSQTNYIVCVYEARSFKPAQLFLISPSNILNVSSGRSYFNGTNGQHGSVYWALLLPERLQGSAHAGKWLDVDTWAKERLLSRSVILLFGEGEESPARPGWPRGGCDCSFTFLPQLRIQKGQKRRAKLNLSVISAFC